MLPVLNRAKMNVTIIGLIAAFLTTIAFLPQVIKVWKTKKAEDLSLKTFILLSTGIFLWLVYGILLQDLPLILANAVTFTLAITILFFKLRYSKN